jgi:ABC-type transport system substrate-binding protein
MNDFLRLSRRRLTVAGGAGLACRGVTPNALRAAAQGDPAPWRIADGLRLAGSVSGPGSLDPARSRDLATNFLLRQVFRGLMSLDVALRPVPELAETVSVSADGLLHEFVLRDTARFHDGRTVTPDDVLGTLSRALDPATTGGDVDALAAIPYLRDIVGAGAVLAGESRVLDGVTITGDRTLTITLDGPSPTFLMKLASVPASVVDVQQVQSDPAWLDQPNGSGPFAVTKWLPQESIELAASDAWWAGRPAVPRIHFRLGASASQPLNLFQAGEIDLLDDIPPDLVDLINDPATGAPLGTMQEVPLFATSYIALGNAVPPLDDVHVRRALQFVFPNTLVAEATFDGAVRPAFGILPPALLDHDWPTTTTSANAEAALEELRRSRYGSASLVPPVIIYAADIAAVEALRDIAAEKLGLVVEAVLVGWPDFLDGLASRRFPAYALYWGADYPDPESLIDMLFGSESPENYTGYANPDLDALLAEARLASGPARVAVYEQANQLLMDDAALIAMYHPVGYTATRPGIAGATATAMGLLGLETIYQQ